MLFAYAITGQYDLPIAVTSSSSNERLIVALVTWSDKATLLSVTTTPLDKNMAISYSSFCSVGVSVGVSFCFFVSLTSIGSSWPILIKNFLSSSVSAILAPAR